ncbi:MAG: hypothetical protein JNL88_05820 [Bacteroidia bacterium]|nr:hypothetical protein [Bacteroidia bacterium]
MKNIRILILPLFTVLIMSSVLRQSGIAGKTGSPGEPTCVDCHSDFALNSGGGSISIGNTGMNNWQYVPGQTYPITVTVSHQGSSLFGLGLECLTSSNNNAGTFGIVNSSTQLMTRLVAGVSRINVVHTLNGGTGTNSKTFTFNWTAPPAGTGNVTFYFTGNAANGDDSTGGDYIYGSSKVLTEFICQPPATPGSISGSAYNNCGVSTKTYSVVPVSGATSYTWRTDIAGASLNGVPDSVTTSQPTVNLTFPANFSNAKLYVKAKNACGSSAEKAKTLSSKPAVPASITGPLSPCINSSGLVYSTTAVNGANSYTWTVPSSGFQFISGQGSTSITLQTKSNAVICTLKVASVNACGSSNKRKLTVHVNSCLREYEVRGQSLVFNEVPVCAEVYATDGRLMRTEKNPQKEFVLSGLDRGIYLVLLRYQGYTKSEKIYVE